jgi:hypothetical protein
MLSQNNKLLGNLELIFFILSLYKPTVSIMNENIVLQVILHEGDGLEIRLGNEDKISPLMLIGILEQVKMNILSGIQIQDLSEVPTESKAIKYDA